jgi:2'-5' RNA ligase
MSLEYSYTAVAAFVPEPYRTRLATDSRALAEKHKSWFVLDETEFPPHVTIWIAYIPTRNVPAVQATTEEVLRHVTPFGIHIGDTKVENGGYVSIEVDITDQLRNLHNALLARLNQFREGYLDKKYADTLASFPPDQQESLKRYGTRKAGPLFTAHITVGVASPDSVPAVREELQPKLQELKGKTLPIKELFFFRQGKPGRSVEVLCQYQLNHK